MLLQLNYFKGAFRYTIALTQFVSNVYVSLSLRARLTAIFCLFVILILWLLLLYAFCPKFYALENNVKIYGNYSCFASFSHDDKKILLQITTSEKNQYGGTMYKIYGVNTATGIMDGQVDTSKSIALSSHEQKRYVIPHSNEKYIFYNVAQRQLDICDSSGKVLSSIVPPNYHDDGMFFSRDGRYVAFKCMSGSLFARRMWVEVWCLKNCKKVYSTRDYNGYFCLCAITWAEKESLLAVAIDNRSLIVTDCLTGWELYRICFRENGKNLPMFFPQFSLDGNHILINVNQGNNRYGVLLNSRTGRKLCSVFAKETSEGIDWAVVTPDGRYDGSENLLKYLLIKLDGEALKDENFKSIEELPKENHVPGLLATFFNDD